MLGEELLDWLMLELITFVELSGFFFRWSFIARYTILDFLLNTGSSSEYCTSICFVSPFM